MALKAPASIDLALTLFGGLDTSLKPTDLPEGLSPANNDVIFGPGFVASRPCASKLFAVPFPGNPRVLSLHEYLQENQQPLNLYLDSLGVLRKEDVTNSPGTYSTVGNVVANAMMKAVTFENIDYQVFSDGIHGIDIPRIYDGTNWDRLTQDGPAIACATIADRNVTVNISAINDSLPAVAIASATEVGTTATITTAAPHGITFVGSEVIIAGVGVAGYNGNWTITSIPTPTSLTYTAAAGLAAAGAGGTAQSGNIRVTTATPHGLILNDEVVIAGTIVPLYNNGTAGVPATWTVVQITDATHFDFVQFPQGAVGAGGTVNLGGQITAGVHGMVTMFLTRNGDLTHPSPPIQYSCGGNKQAAATGLPIGPANVVARVCAFTGTGGANYFTSLVSGAGINALIVPDNTSTTAVFDFSDNALFAAEAIDIPGNDLFNLVTLAPCLGIDAYASRLFVWGEFNKAQNFINMGFEGGTAAVGGPNPLGWTIPGAGGTLVAAPNGFGLAWQITGDGTANPRGLITQTAYKNYLQEFILEPSTQYTFYCWAVASAPALAGSLFATLSSASTGFTATAAIAANTIPTTGQFIHLDLNAITPAVIPADLILQIDCISLPLGATVIIDEMMLVFTKQPYRETVMRGSYVNNPSAFDGVTGDIGPTDDTTPIKDTFTLNAKQFTILTAFARHVTTDNDQEPGTWEVDRVETNVGAPSVHSTTTGPNWAMWVADTGTGLALRITSGGESFKISREMKADFSAVNMTQKHKVWLTNVDDESRAYIGLPQGEVNVTAVLDYFESDTAQDIAGNRPLKIGFTGKMLTTDLARKWTIWNIPLASGAVLSRPGGVKRFVGGSGTSLGLGPFGNAYFFDANKLTDDDYGQMAPSYTTYFFVNHDMEQNLQLGALRKYYSALTTFVTGVGYLQIAARANVFANIVKRFFFGDKPWALTQDLADDIELTGADITARRLAFTVSVLPLAGTTDVQFVLSHFAGIVARHPVSPQAGVNRGSP